MGPIFTQWWISQGHRYLRMPDFDEKNRLDGLYQESYWDPREIMMAPNTVDLLTGEGVTDPLGILPSGRSFFFQMVTTPVSRSQWSARPLVMMMARLLLPWTI